MAIDITSVCATASTSQGSQTLAVVLSIMFSLYVVVSIALSALTIYSTSQVTPTAHASAVAVAALAPPLVNLNLKTGR